MLLMVAFLADAVSDSIFVGKHNGIDWAGLEQKAVSDSIFWGKHNLLMVAARFEVAVSDSIFVGKQLSCNQAFSFS